MRSMNTPSYYDTTSSTPMHLLPAQDFDGNITEEESPHRHDIKTTALTIGNKINEYEINLLDKKSQDVEHQGGGSGGGVGSNNMTPMETMELDDMPGEVKVIKARETWDKKIDFLLSVIGFAVDLGNVWRFPYICFRNGGGAFLIPYCLMYVFGGLPLFYLELALGQFQRCGCITVWKRICPMFKGVGFGICVLASYTAWYYNTIMAWALFYMINSFGRKVPWDSCNNWWNSDNCVTVTDSRRNLTSLSVGESAAGSNMTFYVSSTEEYFFLRVLQINNSDGLGSLGKIRWEIAVCLMAIFTIVYFSLWKGVKSSGKAVWVTATLPYIVLFILLVRGLMLKGSLTGVKYYLTPKFEVLKDPAVWNDAASQIFFSLGPGFGVILALSSYNRFHNNCYADALVTSFINCATSFLAGFVVFSVLGHMCHKLNKDMTEIAAEGPGLVFIAYPEAIATLTGSVFWSIMFFLMLITLGLDSTFGGLESVITAILDEWPWLRKHRELFVLAFVIYCFLGALPTTTEGGFYMLNWLDQFAVPISILFIVFCECVAICWFYGVDRFSQDIKCMLGFVPGIFWRTCWTYISPFFLLLIFCMNLAYFDVKPALVFTELIPYPDWSKKLGWLLVASSIINVPIFIYWKFHTSTGDRITRLMKMLTPEELPAHVPEDHHPQKELELHKFYHQDNFD